MKAAVIEGILNVLDGTLKKYETEEYEAPANVIKFMVAKRYEQVGEFETNGWQYDWWLTFAKDGKSFTAFGCGYDGGFMFEPAED